MSKKSGFIPIVIGFEQAIMLVPEDTLPAVNLSEKTASIANNSVSSKNIKNRQ
jgi:hypothetical protein